VAELDRSKRAGRLAGATPGLAPHRVVQIVREAMPADTLATADAGAHMVAVMAFWDTVAPGEFLVSSGLATMGFALPAAIAAALARPGRRVVCFTGAGGLMTALAELETAARLGLPLIVVVFDDAGPSLIRGEQAPRGMTREGLMDGAAAFADVARGLGVAGLVADGELAFKEAVARALAASGPVLVDARIDPTGHRAAPEAGRGV
jgi:acetolactate synthase-1/2/3 large subunit